MKFALLTYHSTDEEYNKLASISIPNKSEFCKRWNYDLFVLTDQNSKLDAFYAKYETLMVARMLLDKDIDWLWVLDIDSVITNMTSPLDSFVDNDYHFIIASDFNEINAGSYFVRNSVEGKKFLDHIIDLFPVYSQKYGREQQAIVDNALNFPNVVKVVPQKTINAYQYDLYSYRYPKAQSRNDTTGSNGEWDESSLLIHFPDTKGDQRYSLVQEYLQKVKV